MAKADNPVERLLFSVRRIKHDLEVMQAALARLETAAEEVGIRDEYRKIVASTRGKPLIRLRPAEREAIVGMYEKGMTMRELVDASGYGPNILTRELLAAGILIRGRGHTRKAA